MRLNARRCHHCVGIAQGRNALMRCFLYFCVTISLPLTHESNNQIVQAINNQLTVAFISPRAALTNAHFQPRLMIRRQHFALTRGCAPLPCGGAHVACQRLCRGAKLPPLRCTARHAAEPRSKAPEGQMYFNKTRSLLCSSRRR